MHFRLMVDKKGFFSVTFKSSALISCCCKTEIMKVTLRTMSADVWSFKAKKIRSWLSVSVLEA